MRYSGTNWLALFSVEKTAVDATGESSLKRGDSNVLNYRVKTIRSGNQIEVEAVPVWSTIPSGLPMKKSREAMSRANAENARKHFGLATLNRTEKIRSW